MRAEQGSTGAVAYVGEGWIDGVVFDGWAATVFLAARLRELAVHVHQALGAGPLVQVVDILGAEEEAFAETRLQVRESEVRGIRLGLLRGQTPRRVELPHKSCVALQRFGSADVLDAVAGPEAVGGAKGGQSTLRADAGAGEDEDAIVGGDLDGRHSRSEYCRRALRSGAAGLHAVAEELDSAKRTEGGAFLPAEDVADVVADEVDGTVGLDEGLVARHSRLSPRGFFGTVGTDP